MRKEKKVIDLKTNKTLGRYEREVCFSHIKPYNKDVYLICNVLQHYDELCSHESRSSLLTSLLAENNAGEGALKALRQSFKNTINPHFKR